ncbi:unnamed protein product [Miscanthus lutarioriparius]|uniref:protein-disulfide reductase n=1 Tax=Miscanthus lutarioriparius TaxID=422564 RepID=A0A811QWF3_9POAL|nr:unnamed protein product [Miscanthus lutarioriparius]
MGGGEEVKKEVNMSQLAGVQFHLSNEGKEVPLSSIEGKTTCLFFSAHWCRPCRNFTPNLVQIYTALQNTGKNIEIIFISLDRDDASFWDHFKGMQWLALPFDTGLRQKFGVGFEEDAVKLVDEYGEDAYPFSAQRRRELEAMDDARRKGGKLQELLGCKERDYVISADDIKIPIADLTGKTVSLYFGAHWCPLLPCLHQTTQGDRNKGEFQASMSSMPWLAIPYSDTARQKLTRIFTVKGIPGLLILGLDGKVRWQDSNINLWCNSIPIHGI